MIDSGLEDSLDGVTQPRVHRDLEDGLPVISAGRFSLVRDRVGSLSMRKDKTK
jgi:hypothetical protein